MNDARLEEIEGTIRREFPGLPDGAKFAAVPTEAGEGSKMGLTFPIPEGVMLAILVPNPKWPDRPPQYRRVGRWRPATEYDRYEKQRARIVGSPDVVMMDFRAAAKEAVTLARNMKELN